MNFCWLAFLTLYSYTTVDSFAFICECKVFAISTITYISFLCSSLRTVCIEIGFCECILYPAIAFDGVDIQFEVIILLQFPRLLNHIDFSKSLRRASNVARQFSSTNVCITHMLSSHEHCILPSLLVLYLHYSCEYNP